MCWLVAFVSIIHIGGQPEQHGGLYYLNDHGSLIPASHEDYRHALVLQQRIFTLVPAVFFAFAVIANAAPPWGVRLGCDAAPSAGE